MLIHKPDDGTVKIFLYRRFQKLGSTAHGNRIQQVAIYTPNNDMPMTTPRRTRTAQSGPAQRGDGSFTFPPNHHLVIATENNILACDKNGVRRIFKSASSGILAAKEARDGSGTLAVADSQIVVLHRVPDESGMERSYRLKGADVCVSIDD